MSIPESCERSRIPFQKAFWFTYHATDRETRVEAERQRTQRKKPDFSPASPSGPRWAGVRRAVVCACIGEVRLWWGDPQSAGSRVSGWGDPEPPGGIQPD